ncbi:MAG TPA: hypothetical protein VGI36_22120 [Candidatus Binataceae bacterium]
MIRVKFWLVGFLVLGLAVPASAQTSLEIPQSQSQNPVPIPSFTPRSVPSSSAQEGGTLQIAPAPAATPSTTQQLAPAPQTLDPAVAAAAAAAAALNALLVAQPTPGAPPEAVVPTPASPPPSSPLTSQAEPKLPQVFRGCWEGEVVMVDDLERLPGAHKVGYWTPKTYRLCYQRIGEGPFHLTFSETGVVPNEQIRNARGHVDALATDGRGYAKMRSDLRFDENHVEPGLRGSTFAVDEITMLDCRIRDEAMAVSAEVYGTRDDEPWFKARWHADFRHVPQ